MIYAFFFRQEDLDSFSQNVSCEKRCFLVWNPFLIYIHMIIAWVMGYSSLLFIKPILVNGNDLRSSYSGPLLFGTKLVHLVDDFTFIKKRFPKTSNPFRMHHINLAPFQIPLIDKKTWKPHYEDKFSDQWNEWIK